MQAWFCVQDIEHTAVLYHKRIFSIVYSMRRSGKLTPNRLRKHRLLMGYEQKEVAELLGFKSHARISEWEQGISKPSLINLLQLSIIYQTLPDELYYDVRQECVKEIRQREKLLQQKRDMGG